MIERTESEIMKSWGGDASKPLVSICTITYNHEKYIEEALDSFLIQDTNFPFEIVVDDDFSSDNTPEVIKKYIKIFPKIFNVRLRKNNVGSMINFIENIQRAKGEYIAICEGDDYWTNPKKLQIQIDLMVENSNCELSFHVANELKNNQLTGKLWGDCGNKNKVFTGIEMIRNIGNVFCPTASMIFKSKVIDPIPSFFYTAPVGDDFMQYLASVNGGALFIAREMSIYRTGNPGSFNSIMKEKTAVSVEKLIELKEYSTFSYIKSLDEMGKLLDNKFRKEIDKKISNRLFLLSYTYLKNYMDKDFKKMIIRSYDVYEYSSLTQTILYKFRFFPFLAREIIKFKLRNEVFIKKYLR